MGRRRRGANAVEFALLLPVFVLLLGITMDMGWMLFQRGAVRAAVSRGCRDAALVDPGVNEADMAAILASAETNVLSRYEAQGGTCDGCIAVAAPVGTVPQRSLRCGLQVPYAPLTSLVDISGTFVDTVVVRFEYQRRNR